MKKDILEKDILCMLDFFNLAHVPSANTVGGV